jgi:hypothetical protein
METGYNLTVLAVIGTIGGLLGYESKITGGTLIGAMLAVMAFKMLSGQPWAIPRGYAVFAQIVVGVMVGAAYTSETGRMFVKIAFPVVVSTCVLVLTGLAIGLVLIKTGVLSVPTGYLSTSPGAMSAMAVLAGDTSANMPVVLAFHFFRLVFIIVTAPLVLNLLQKWMGSAGG